MLLPPVHTTKVARICHASSLYVEGVLPDGDQGPYSIKTQRPPHGNGNPIADTDRLLALVSSEFLSVFIHCLALPVDTIIIEGARRRMTNVWKQAVTA